MQTAQEIRIRIAWINEIRERLRVCKEKEKNLEQEMEEAIPKHPWSIRQRRNYNNLQYEMDDMKDCIGSLEQSLRGYIGQLLLDTDVFRDASEMVNPANSLELLLGLVDQSLSTDMKYRLAVRGQMGMCGAHDYMRNLYMRYPEGVPVGVTPPTPWGEEKARKAYELGQVQTLDPSLALLRTLNMKAYSDAEDEEYRGMMTFEEGQHVTLGPGLSTSATEPHWLGGNGILQIFDGVPNGVPMVGLRI